MKNCTSHESREDWLLVAVWMLLVGRKTIRNGCLCAIVQQLYYFHDLENDSTIMKNVAVSQSL